MHDQVLGKEVSEIVFIKPLLITCNEILVGQVMQLWYGQEALVGQEDYSVFLSTVQPYFPTKSPKYKRITQSQYQYR